MVLAGVDCRGGAVLLCGGYEHYQLHGWDQWNYGGIRNGNAGAYRLG